MAQTTLTAYVDFAPALRAIPNLGRKKTPCDPRICGKVKGPLYGRNEHIGHFIARQTGVRRNRKQISSHIQVLKSFQKGNAECTISTIQLVGMKANLSGMALVSKSAPSDLESQPLDVHPPDPIQGPPSSIHSSDPETPVGDHVNVALPTTPTTDCFPLPSSSCNSYHSSFSESTSYRSSLSNSQHSAACTSYCSSFSGSFGSGSQDFPPQPQNNSCYSHGDCGSTANSLDMSPNSRNTITLTRQAMTTGTLKSQFVNSMAWTSHPFLSSKRATQVATIPLAPLGTIFWLT